MCLSGETIEKLDVSGLADLSSDLNAAVTVAEMAQTAGKSVSERLHLDACCVLFRESANSPATTLWSFGTQSRAFLGLDAPDGPAMHVFRTGRTDRGIASDGHESGAGRDETFPPAPAGPSPLPEDQPADICRIFAPIKASGRTHAVLAIARRLSGPFGRGEEAFVDLVCNMAGAAMQRILAETRHARREAMYRTVLEKSRSIMLMLDQEGRVVFESPSTRAQLGYSLMESMDREFMSWVHPRDTERAARMIAAVADICCTATRIKMRGRDDWQTFDVRFSPSGRDDDAGTVIVEICEAGQVGTVDTASAEEDRARLEAEAVESARREFEARAHERLAIELAVIRASATMLSNDFDRAVENVLQEVGNALKANRTSLYLLDCDGTTMEDSWHWLSSDNALPGNGIPVPSESLMPWAFAQFRDGRPVIVNSPSELPAEASSEKRLLAETGVSSSIWLPMHVEGLLAGVMCIDDPSTEGNWVAEDLQLLEMVPNLINSALSRRRILTELLEGRDTQEKTLKSLRKTLEGTIQAIVRTVETRDPYTAGHQRRVSNLSRTIAARIGLPPERIDAVRLAGSIHDLGKIGVPVEILARPGSLSTTEFELIKSHSHIGYNILKDIDFPWPVADIVRQHHERIDGSGYPAGLKGEDIMMEARILGVADVVEAMATHRPYRPALGVKAALNEIKSGAGVLYDPVVTKVCVDLIENENFEL